LHDTPELREEILLSNHQVLFLIIRGDERPPRERLGHSNWWWRENPTHDIYSIKKS